MRVDLKKFLFIGTASTKDQFILACQASGSIQFEGTRVSTPDLLANDFFDVTQAIKILQQYGVEQTPHVSIVDPISFSRMVVGDKLRLEEASLELKGAKERYETIAPFGPIPLPLIKELEAKTSLHFRLWSASAKRHMAEACPHLIEVASSDTKQYFVSLSKEPISGLEEIPLTEEMVSLSTLIHTLTEKIDSLEDLLRHRAAFVISLRRALLDELDATKRLHVSDNTLLPLENRLFAISGWVPETLIKTVNEISLSMNVLAEEVPILSGEIPPTYLENKHIAQVGEDLVSIYDTPACSDTDPSMWVLVFFSLFFAMIIEDAGYGLVFLLTALFLHKGVQKKSSAGKRLIKLTAILGLSCTLWGLFTHSFFGMELSPDFPLRKYSPLTYLVERQAEYHFSHKDHTVTDWTRTHGSEPTSFSQFLYEPPAPNNEALFDTFSDHTAIELALLIGSIHIIVSILRYLPKRVHNAGWIPFIIGGYLFCCAYLQATSFLYYLFGLDPVTSSEIGLELVYTGFAFSFIAAIFKHGIAGAFEIISSAVQVFADILSYLRIYALALAGSIIAGKINELGGCLPFVPGAVIIIFAHVVNMFVSIMGGVIHGLRLNFLEWYHYSFDGGGKPFTPLKLEERL